jgi:DNA-binding Lrp family transcriptional regulator
VPDGSLPIARALARRDDISWIMLTSAGAEITCLATTASAGQRDALLLGTLPRARPIVSVDTLCVLRTFSGGATGWAGRAGALTAAQEDQIRHSGTVPLARPGDPVVLDDQDERMLAELRLDGRLPLTGLAMTLGCSETAAGRRLDRLIASGVLFFDAEIAPEYLGYELQALLWVTVRPADLEATATAAAAHAPVAMAAATSGTTNLVLAVGCRDVAGLYDYLAHDLGRLPGVREVETTPLIRTVKRAGSLLDPAGRG